VADELYMNRPTTLIRELNDDLPDVEVQGRPRNAATNPQGASLPIVPDATGSLAHQLYHYQPINREMVATTQDRPGR